MHKLWYRNVCCAFYFLFIQPKCCRQCNSSDDGIVVLHIVLFTARRKTNNKSQMTRGTDLLPVRYFGVIATPCGRKRGIVGSSSSVNNSFIFLQYIMIIICRCDFYQYSTTYSLRVQNSKLTRQQLYQEPRVLLFTSEMNHPFTHSRSYKVNERKESRKMDYG